MQVRLADRFVEERLGFAGTGSAAKQAVFCLGFVKFELAYEWLVFEFGAEFVKLANACFRQPLGFLGWHLFIAAS